MYTGYKKIKLIHNKEKECWKMSLSGVSLSFIEIFMSFLNIESLGWQLVLILLTPVRYVARLDFDSCLTYWYFPSVEANNLQCDRIVRMLTGNYVERYVGSLNQKFQNFLISSFQVNDRSVGLVNIVKAVKRVVQNPMLRRRTKHLSVNKC